MKISVSLSQDDVAFLDAYARAHACSSRSAVLQRAVAVLRDEGLADEYEKAFTEWGDHDAGAWDSAVGDGIDR